MDILVTPSGHQKAFVKHVCSLPLCSPFSLRKKCRRPYKTTTSRSSSGDRPVSNLRFADDIDLMGGTSSELHDLANILCEKAVAYVISLM
ncbi:hypothetical protein DPMN_140084 [Dreissena polymorpha]|uniref:Uncharacterized protein n=1 Tax=Dreissena polymorpha TaxID=45954 RepID=A0A9D4JLF2_DREPO|nr:hypothetical protein DPMN_140084 [Dreissena polymorpha]